MNVQNNPVQENRFAEFYGAFKKLPLKIGAPSYVWPEGYAENVEKLMPVFGEIQILAFESFDKSPIGKSEIELLKNLKTAALNYSLHLPAPSRIAEPGGKSAETISRIIKATRPLKISFYVLHAEKFEGKFQPQIAAGNIEKIIRKTGVSPKQICMENLPGIPFAELWEAVKHLGISVCIDVGHLIMEGNDPFAFIDKYQDRIKMAHLHGVADRDHRPITSMTTDYIAKLFGRLKEIEMPGAVIIENYTPDEMLESLKSLKEVSLYLSSEVKI